MPLEANMQHLHLPGGQQQQQQAPGHQKSARGPPSPPGAGREPRKQVPLGELHVSPKATSALVQALVWSCLEGSRAETGVRGQPRTQYLAMGSFAMPRGRGRALSAAAARSPRLQSRSQLRPVDGLLARLPQQLIGFRKMPAAKEASVHRQGGGVGRLQDVVPLPVDGAALPLSVGAPEQEDEATGVVVQPGHDRVGELLPAPVLMGSGLVGADGEHGVEQQHALLGPPGEIAMARMNEAFYVCGQLFVNVFQTGWRRDRSLDAEAEPVRLTGSMIWILSQDDNFHVSYVTHLGPCEDLVWGRINCVMLSFFRNKSHELDKVRLPELPAEVLLPALPKAHGHVAGREPQQGRGLVPLDADQLLGAERRRGRSAGLVLPGPGLLGGAGLRISALLSRGRHAGPRGGRLGAAGVSLAGGARGEEGVEGLLADHPEADKAANAHRPGTR